VIGVLQDPDRISGLLGDEQAADVAQRDEKDAEVEQRRAEP